MSPAGAEHAPSTRVLTLAATALVAVAAGVYFWALGADSGAGHAPPTELRVAATPAADAEMPLSAAHGASPGAVGLADLRPTGTERHDPNAEPHETPPARSEDFPVYDAATSAQVPLESAPAETAGADPINERAALIRAAGEGGGPDALALLLTTLSSDASARNRLLAINSLRRLGGDPDLAPRVLDALQAAQSDTDPNVVRHARAAYDELAA